MEKVREPWHLPRLNPNLAHVVNQYRPAEYINLRPPLTRMRTSAKSAMPRRTTLRTRFRRRRRTRFGRRKNYRRRPGIPWKIVRVFKTVNYISLNPGAAGAIDVRTMVPTSCHDPTGDEGTGKPLGFDEAAAMYDKYCVIGGRYLFEATSADATNPIVVGCNVQTDSTELTSYEHYKELAGTSSRLMTPDVDKVTFGNSFSLSKLFGTKVKLSDDRFTASVTSLPANVAYAHIFAQPVDKSADAGNVHLVCTLYQTVVFFRPKTLARS